MSIYAVVVEGATQPPIIMETEAGMTSHEQAYERLRTLLRSEMWFRGCVVRLTYESGNEAVLHQMEALQK